MNSAPGSCDCNDYSLLSANTGMVTISDADLDLTGASAVSVLTGGHPNGTIIRSVIIKATGPVTDGMVRLFIQDPASGAIGLYREVPIPATPALNSTPTPFPMLQTFEVCLEGDIVLASQAVLLASTQNAESFNIIVDGLDFVYPNTLPETCCNFRQETTITGVNTVSTANPNLDGTGTIENIFFGGNFGNGARIKAITIKALQSTNEGMIRLFINDGTTNFLMKEIYVPETTQSGFNPSFKVVLQEDFHIEPGFRIKASTQIGQSFSIVIEGSNWSYPIS